MAAEAPIVVATARYVLLPLANLVTGYSVKDARHNNIVKFIYVLRLVIGHSSNHREKRRA
jgi:hypothetical protein